MGVLWYFKSTDAYHIFLVKTVGIFSSCLLKYSEYYYGRSPHCVIGQQNLLLVSNCKLILIYPIPPYLHIPQPQETLILLTSFRLTSHSTCQCLYFCLISFHVIFIQQKLLQINISSLFRMTR